MNEEKFLEKLLEDEQRIIKEALPILGIEAITDVYIKRRIKFIDSFRKKLAKMIRKSK